MRITAVLFPFYRRYAYWPKALLLCVIALLFAAPTWAQTPVQLTIGQFAYRPKLTLEAMWAPLVRRLDDSLPDHVSLRLRILSQDEMKEALHRNELHYVFTNPVHYVELRETNRLSGALATLIAKEGNTAVSALGGVVVRRPDRTDIQRFDDLRKRKVAIAGTLYLGGYTAQSVELRERGIDPESLDYLVTGQPHDLVVQAVLDGRADAGYIRTGVIEQLQREGILQPGDLTVIEPVDDESFPFVRSTRLYPEWAFVALPHAPEDISRRITAMLLDLDSNSPEARLAQIEGFTIPSDYAVVQRAMQSLRLPPFDKAPEFGWRDVWQRYQPALLAGFAAIALIVGLAIALGLISRRERQGRLLSENLHARLEDLAANVPGVLYQYRQRADGTGHFPFASRGLETIYGCAPDAVREDASPVFKVVHPEDLPHLGESIRRSAETFTVWHDEYRVVHTTKGEFWVQGTATPSAQDDGGILWHGYLRDITETRQAQERLRLAAQVFEASREGIVIMDAQGRIIDVNAAFTRHTGYSLTDLAGKTTAVLESPQQPRAFYEQVRHAVKTRGHWNGEYWVRTREGESHPHLVAIVAVLDDHGRPANHVAIISDIRELKAHQQELDRMAHLDPLTGLPNRRRLLLELDRAIVEAQGQGATLAVCMLDLDRFKPVNDAFGHEAGDLLLVELARRFSRVLRVDDTVARLGGDEFVVLLPNAAGDEVFERLLQVAREPVVLPDGVVHVSASLGVAYMRPGLVVDAQQLLREADRALYAAKRNGRDRYSVFAGEPAEGERFSEA